MSVLLYIVAFCILIYLIICTIYIVTFSISSFLYKPINEIKSVYNNKIAILIPAYHEDKVIFDSVNSALAQDYDDDRYDIHVISDGMCDQTNEKLISSGINVINASFSNSSKAASLNYASSQIKDYDYIIILDADNIIPTNYISKINSFINTTNCTALQTHRQSKGISNSVSYMDSVIEEINNTIFRKGHNALGVSSTLIGSGMVLEFKWFKNNITSITSTGEDKELEEALLDQQLYIYYSNEITFKDEKTSNKKNIDRQRRRWIATQFYLLKVLVVNLFSAIKKRNRDYILKTIETLILPKSIFIGLLFITSVVTSFVSFKYSIICWTLLICVLLSMYIAIPKAYRDKRLLHSIINMPYLFIMMAMNIFKIREANKSFIHTKHGEK